MSAKRSFGQGFLAGALGGALGTAALIGFQAGSLKATEWAEDALGAGHRNSREQQGLARMFEKAHMKTAEAVASALKIELSGTARNVAAPVTEIAFGILCAGVYGAAAEYLPAVTAGSGTLYGAVLFAGASELVLPAIHFVPQPSARTATQHLGGLAGNVVYGAVTEVIRRALRG